MRKSAYIRPFTESISLHSEHNIADFYIGVSGETTPEESDGKETRWEEDEDYTMSSSQNKKLNVWE